MAEIVRILEAWTPDECSYVVAGTEPYRYLYRIAGKGGNGRVELDTQEFFGENPMRVGGFLEGNFTNLEEVSSTLHALAECWARWNLPESKIVNQTRYAENAETKGA
ncbi:MAG: hypothetical protein KJ600_04245 [Nanoarchaeota archaeon]|nr:hypothetical protein [Nanoarchaeota archaeon]MBU1103738.1 hypothetical protein [Nanoarchaeota archaeon]